MQITRFRLPYIQSWRNLRTFQGLPLEFKYLSSLCEPCHRFFSEITVHRANTFTTFTFKSSKNVPQDFALFFLIDDRLLFSFSPGDHKHILHILISICLNYIQSSVRRFFASLLDTRFWKFINPFTAKCGQRQVSNKFPNFIFQNCEKQIASCERRGRELWFEWSHHRISSTDSKVRVTLQNSIKHSGSERVKLRTTLLSFIKSWRISTPQGTTSHKTVNFLQWQKQK